MAVPEVRLTHPDEAITRMINEQRRRADQHRENAASYERRALERQQSASRHRLLAMECDQVADRLMKLIPSSPVVVPPGNYSPTMGREMAKPKSTPVRLGDDDDDYPEDLI